MRGSKRLRPDRGGQWQLRVDAGRDPVTGKRRQRSKMFTGSAREADRELARMVAAFSDDLVAPTDATLGQLVHRWYDHAHDGLSPSTRQGYEWRIRLIDDALGDVRLSKLTAEHLDRFYLALLREGGRQGRGQAPATVNQTHSIIRRSLEMGMRWGWIGRNVADWATKPTVHRDEIEVPTEVELSRLLDAVREHPQPVLWPLVRLAVVTGARRGELCGLRWNRVDWKRRSVTYSASVVQLRGSGWVEKSTKTRRGRTVSLDPGTVRILEAHREWSEAFCVEAGVALDPKGFVFRPDPTSDDPWLPDRVTNLWRRLPDAQRVRLHDLRHLSVSLLLDAGVPVGAVSRRVGHSQTSVTVDIYGHSTEGEDARSALVLGDLLDGLT